MTVYEACEKIQAAKDEIDRIQNEDEMTERDDALLAILVDIDRYFKEGENGWDEITFEEYDNRRWTAETKKGE